MKNPVNLSYTKSHEWLEELEEDVVRVGLTDFAQDSLGDLVFVNLPQVGDAVTAGEVFADVESVKAVSDVYSPLSGEVTAVNEELLDAPQLINESPYGAWIIEVGDLGDRQEMMDADAYEAFCAREQ